MEMPIREKEYPTEDAIAQCNGTLYRECDVLGNNRSDMCYNLCMMAIACTSELLPVEMRKRQIAESWRVVRCTKPRWLPGVKVACCSTVKARH